MSSSEFRLDRRDATDAADAANTADAANAADAADAADATDAADAADATEKSSRFMTKAFDHRSTFRSGGSNPIFFFLVGNEKLFVIKSFKEFF